MKALFLVLSLFIIGSAFGQKQYSHLDSMLQTARNPDSIITIEVQSPDSIRGLDDDRHGILGLFESSIIPWLIIGIPIIVVIFLLLRFTIWKKRK
jgi:hypothetical protein